MRLVKRLITAAFVVVLSGHAVAPAWAAEALIAVATNFAAPMEELSRAFAETTPHALTVAAGSSGKLFAQITHGAPFDAFLSADRERPSRLIDAAIAEPGSQFTYAQSKLVLWTTQQTAEETSAQSVLAKGAFRKLAIANPELAPYGAAAKDVLIRYGVSDILASKIVLGENVGQAFALTATGNAEYGLIAASSLLAALDRPNTRSWPIPSADHRPIRQDAVLLRRGKNNPAAQEFLTFLQGTKAQTIIARFGYEPGDE